MTDQAQTQSSDGAGADVETAELSEWLAAIEAVVSHDGPDRARLDGCRREVGGNGLSSRHSIDPARVMEGLERHQIDAEAPLPTTV